jgi:hypothetical protein
MPAFAAVRRAVVCALFIASSLAPTLAHAHRGDDHGLAVAATPPAAAPRETHVGAVVEVVMDDRVAGLTYRDLGLRMSDGTVLSLRGNGIDALRAGMQIEAAGARDRKVLFIDTWQEQAGTTAPARETREKSSSSARGKLRILHSDNFDEGTSAYSYEVEQDAGSAVPVKFATVADSLRPGMDVAVEGTLAADGVTLEASRVTIFALAPPATEDKVATKAVTTNKVLVILIRFTDSPASPFTQAQVQTSYGGGAGSGSVAEYYKEGSYGQQLLNVTVTPWLSSSSATPANCDFTTIGTRAESAATAASFNPANYNYVVYVFPRISACGWAGLAYIGYPHKSWINGTNAVQVYSHELGHNFGLLHAASVSCGAPIVGSGCASAEYGDPFDTMGNQRAMHFNAAQKDILGWFSPNAVKVHTTGTSTYVLTPMELAGGTTYAVNVPASTYRQYWIEYRQPIGFDSPLSAFPNLGAIVHIAEPFESICSGCADDTELLDMTPLTSTFTDAALLAGNTYTDASNGFSVNVVSATATALTVSVSMPGTVTPSTTTVVSSPNPSSVGANVTFTATVAGTTPGGTVAFTDNGSTIAGCAAVALAGSGNSRTAACTTNSLAAGSHTIAAAYSGDAGNGASSGSMTQTVNNSASINVALASNGGVATASSQWGPGYPVSSLINNERAGVNWTNGGGWLDGTYNTFPDWVQIAFAGPKTIDHVVVYSLQDNPNAPIQPTNTTTFSQWGVTAFTVQAWTGSAWTTLATVSGNNLVKRTVSFTPYTTDRIRINITSALQGHSRLTEVEAWGTSASADTNVAAASAGASAVASSSYGPGYPASSVINGDRAGLNWTNGGGWLDGTYTSFPDWIQVNFAGQKAIDHVVVYSLQDNPANPVDPLDTMTFSLYGVTAFTVQGWNGSAWVTLGSVSGNNLVKRTVSFAAFTTDRIRINVTAALQGHSRITEVEAWGIPASQQTNVALAANGAVASASSTYSPGYPASSLINNDRAGVNWINGGGWLDGTYSSFPDWAQVNFAGSKTIDHVVVYSLQDNPAAPVEPSDTMTFSLYGATNFTVQGWNGSGWVTLGSVSGNNLVRRSVSFASFTTDRIRVTVTAALQGYSRLTEIEAWGN